MKRKLKKLMLVIGLMAVGILAIMTHPQNVDGAISGTKHDFSTEGWSGGLICRPCHTPHNADTTVALSPLWNHELSTATYSLYTTTTMNGNPNQPTNTISSLCLCCHDGSVALDSYGGTTGGNYISTTVGAFLSTDLRDDHPISFTYNSTLATDDGELFDPSTTNSGLGSTIANDLLFGSSNDQLECASCHDVHGTSYAPMLVMNNAASALCLKCHNK